jgi:hypothetical protein
VPERSQGELEIHPLNLDGGLVLAARADEDGVTATAPSGLRAAKFLDALYQVSDLHVLLLGVLLAVQ